MRNFLEGLGWLALLIGILYYKSASNPFSPGFWQTAATEILLAILVAGIVALISRR